MNIQKKIRTYQRGMNAEKIAAFWLRLKGYQILEHRYKTSIGEIDLIARRKNVITFVEVKARPSVDEALISITPMMKERISRAAQYYLAKNSQPNCDLRFDVVAVTPLKISQILQKQFFIHHLDNAWASGA